MKEICVLLAIFSVALGAPSYENEGLLTSTIKFVKDCGDKSMVLCFKVRQKDVFSGLNILQRVTN